MCKASLTPTRNIFKLNLQDKSWFVRTNTGVLRGTGPIRRNIEQIKDVIIQSIQIHGTSATRKATIWTKFVLKEPKNKDVNGESEVGSRGWDPTNSA